MQRTPTGQKRPGRCGEKIGLAEKNLDFERTETHQNKTKYKHNIHRSMTQQSASKTSYWFVQKIVLKFWASTCSHKTYRKTDGVVTKPTKSNMADLTELSASNEFSMLTRDVIDPIFLNPLRTQPPPPARAF
jgi:hypothetical protein